MMTTPRTPSSSLRDSNTTLALLRQLLAAHVDAHEALLARLREKHEALRSADFAQVEGIAAEEQKLIMRIGELEQKRSALIARLAPALRVESDRTVRLEHIAERVGEEAAADLRRRAYELRTLVSSIRSESAIVRSAAESLSQHLAGIMQTVQRAVSRATVYGRRGRIDARTPTRFNVDVRS